MATTNALIMCAHNTAAGHLAYTTHGWDVIQRLEVSLGLLGFRVYMASSVFDFRTYAPYKTLSFLRVLQSLPRLSDFPIEMPGASFGSALLAAIPVLTRAPRPDSLLLSDFCAVERSTSPWEEAMGVRLMLSVELSSLSIGHLAEHLIVVTATHMHLVWEKRLLSDVERSPPGCKLIATRRIADIGSCHCHVAGPDHCDIELRFFDDDDEADVHAVLRRSWRMSLEPQAFWQLYDSLNSVWRAEFQVDLLWS